MGRYIASQGIRDVQGSVPGGPFLERFPFLVIFGPSGNAVQVAGPSGFTGRIPENTRELQAYEQTFNHKCLAWYKNEILCSFREGDAVLDKVFGYAWQPFGHSGSKINTEVFTPELNAPLENQVMKDGSNWKQALERPKGAHNEMYAYERLGGSIHWVFPRGDGEVITQGFYKGKDPVFKVVASESGFDSRGGILGARENKNAVVYVPGLAGEEVGENYFGIEYIRDESDKSGNFCDLIFHKGTLYIAKQYAVIGITPGGKGNFLFHDVGAKDTQIINSTTDTTNYTSRSTSNNFGGSLSRSFAEHNGKLYMLSNDGKVHEVNLGGLREVADLSILGTPWSSGVFGGSLVEDVSSGWTGSSNAFRCKMFSFNNQLHAFLNFTTSFKLAQGKGNGVFWATSFDAVNWSDFSEKLPTSGIIPPSGQLLNNWISQISPYRFSGRNGNNAFPYPSGFINGSIGGPKVAGEDNFPAQPSGFRQNGTLPFWSSGNLIDPQGTSFDSLQVPLEKGTVSGFLFPTFIQYPADFLFQAASGGAPSGLPSDIFAPSGVGLSGYSYTGVENFHISAQVDEINKVANVLFTRDYQSGGSFLYELNRSSGWRLRNYIPESKQLNGLISTDLYDPEIIIPSGDTFLPNPLVDEVNKEVKIKYTIYDWLFWDSVNVESEYSIDNGISWRRIGTTKNVGSSTKELDPSGVIGQDHELVWKYTQGFNPLSKNVFYPHVQVRLRAAT